MRDGVPLIAFRTFRTSLPFYLRQPVVLATTTGRPLTSNYVTAQLDRFLDHGTLVRPRHLWDLLDRGVGLVSMRERAELMGGSFAIRAASPRGVIVEIEVPLGLKAPGN